MSAGQSALYDRCRIYNERVAECSTQGVTISGVPCGVNVVRRRMEGLVPTTLKDTKYEAVLGAENIIQFADALQSVFRLIDRVPD